MLTAVIKANADTIIDISMRRTKEHEDGTRDYRGRVYFHSDKTDRWFTIRGHKPSKPDGALRLIQEAISQVIDHRRKEEREQYG